MINQIIKVKIIIKVNPQTKKLLPDFEFVKINENLMRLIIIWKKPFQKKVQISKLKSFLEKLNYVILVMLLLLFVFTI